MSGLPESSETKQAADAAQQGFAAGILSPTEILLQREGLDARRPSLEELQAMIAEEPGVAAVAGPSQESLGMAAAAAAAAQEGGDGTQTDVAAQDPGLAISPDGAAARYVVVLSGDPLGSAGMDQYERLEERLPTLLGASDLGDVETSFAGDTAVTSQTIDVTLRDLMRIAVAAVIVDLLLLILFLRALIAPVYLLAASVLALTASAGVTVVVFQQVFGVADLTYFVPFAAAVLLVSLGSDYNIFLMGHIWHRARLMPLREAIETGVPRATRPISIAAVTLAASFGLLALVPLTSFRQLALLLAVGVLDRLVRGPLAAGAGARGLRRQGERVAGQLAPVRGGAGARDGRRGRSAARRLTRICLATDAGRRAASSPRGPRLQLPHHSGGIACVQERPSQCAMLGVAAWGSSSS